MPDFEDLLNTSMDEVKRPEPLPVGTFAFEAGAQSFVTSSKQTPGVRVECRPYEAVDVSEPLPDGWEKRKCYPTFWITSDALWRLKQFMEVCNVNTTGRTTREALPEITGCRFKAYVTQRAGDDGTIYNDLKQFAPAD